MSKKIFLKTNDKYVKISIEKPADDDNYSVMDLRVEAILSLIRGIDIKEISEIHGNDMYEKYEEYIKCIRKGLRDNKRANGP